ETRAALKLKEALSARRRVALRGSQRRRLLGWTARLTPPTAIGCSIVALMLTVASVGSSVGALNVVLWSMGAAGALIAGASALTFAGQRAAGGRLRVAIAELSVQEARELLDELSQAPAGSQREALSVVLPVLNAPPGELLPSPPPHGG